MWRFFHPNWRLFMRKVTGSLLAAVALVALPHMALAQRRAAGGGGGGAKNEFGVDLGAAFGHVGSGCTASCGTFEAGTPVDLRVGFIGRSFNVEPRLSFLKQMGTNTSRKGLYLTGGAGISIISASGVSSENQFSLNGGVGTRIPEPNTNWRLEGFLRYNFESGALPSGYNVGVRAGMSFWQ